MYCGKPQKEPQLFGIISLKKNPLTVNLGAYGKLNHPTFAGSSCRWSFFSAVCSLA
jgi:hypothetical protein